MGGFEILRQVAAYNTWGGGFDAEADGPRREGIPLELWRALPDSPGAT